MQLVVSQQDGRQCRFTLQGCMKGMNSSLLDPNRDMGRDGSTANDASRKALPVRMFTSVMRLSKSPDLRRNTALYYAKIPTDTQIRRFAEQW
ncbi:MAG: hypothetical protein HC892_14580 [Saprospiraceae bacterium]|nr:hypothetical protein [Saprospiraceae bacterium]